MFGYIVTNAQALSKDRQDRFRGFYCGLCKTLNRRHGISGKITLSYDMTFLALLLNALYEPDENSGEERCALHPLKKHPYTESEVFDYVADMNVALAYHKCIDNWLDDRNIPSAAGAKLLKRAYKKVELVYPDKCRAIEKWIDEIHRIEKDGLMQIDLPVNATGRLLGELFVYDSTDIWADCLRKIGDALGRFVYFMDAYDDLPGDIKHNRYNPLKVYSQQQDFEDMCKAVMMNMMGDCTREFEQLPVVLDADIIRNILYSGVWSKYALIQKQKEAKSKGAK